MTVDLGRLGSLAQDAAGIWRPRASQTSPLSFPADGHDACFALEDSSFWFAHRNACITAALERAQVTGPLLDIGGGNGAVSQALERARIETVLLEPGDAGARNAHRRGLRNVACTTLEDAGFTDGSFAAAGLFDVAEHVSDDTALFRETRRVLRPRGILCVTVPAYRWLWSDEDDVAGHHRRYTLATLCAALDGFAIRYQTYLFSPLVVPVLVARSLRRGRSQAAVEHGAETQHRTSPVVRRLVDAALAPELRAIRAGLRVPFGTSCLAVAEKR
jgi:SAM-dependent methyltransferase